MPSQNTIVLSRPGKFERGTELSPSFGSVNSGESIVRVHRIGVCGTDIHAFHGRQPFFEYPRILGHELGVEVLAGDGLPTGIAVGDFCAVEPYLNNPLSPASQRGKSNCCEELQVLGVHCDGGMRPILRIPSNKLHSGQGLSVDQLALVEMLCIGRHAVERAHVAKDDFAVVFGAGPIGMSVISFLKNAAERVAVVDLSSARLDFCSSTLGIERTIQLSDSTNLEKALREASGDNGLPNKIFDATGNAGSMTGTFELVANGGTIIFVGLFQGDMAFNDPNFHRREITLMASRNATPKDFRAVISDIAAKRVDTDPWITHRMNLDHLPRQFESIIGDPNLRKAIIKV